MRFAGESCWLQNGYKKFEDAVDGLKCEEYLDEKRIESAFYYAESKPDTRVGMISETAESLENQGGFDALKSLVATIWQHFS